MLGSPLYLVAVPISCKESSWNVFLAARAGSCWKCVVGRFWTIFAYDLLLEGGAGVGGGWEAGGGGFELEEEGRWRNEEREKDEGDGRWEMSEAREGAWLARIGSCSEGRFAGVVGRCRRWGLPATVAEDGCRDF
ncbi:hypothetical protein Salat_2712100 [Sesamum alatum]|uniref:Uncharacterized protein n=1 Tax=Sesamum alatum TaxID=300844 RepID=A0AAE1XQ80_9LAMI|nr:hypothetical protein Salat_2712100 [Sesamum alatum]